MLEKMLGKAEYKDVIDELQLKLGELQRHARNLNIPVIMVFEGVDAAGKGTMINRLSLAMDARGFKVNPTNAPTEEEVLRPFLWRFWRQMPQYGRIAIFDRSWYGRVLVARVDKLIEKAVWQHAYDEINIFERQLVDDGAVIIKFFLSISAKEQERRFKKLLDNAATAWKVTKDDWKHHRQYDKYMEAVEEMLEKTSTDCAPWIKVDARKKRVATLTVFSTVVNALQEKIDPCEPEQDKKMNKKSTVELLNRPYSILDKVDLSLSLQREEYEKTLKKQQKKIWELEHEIYKRRIPVIIGYEGWDAGGKGGNIKRLVQGMDPRGYEVVPIAAPNDIEKNHHYLWRFWKEVPKAGHLTIFDRTWYGRVLVERIEQFCGENQWRRAFQEINEMERQWCDFGAVLIKFWIHIDKDEQLKRFKARENTPYKSWKITEEDWRNREKWDDYKEAVDDMLYYTSTEYAPWTIIEGNDKLHARIKALTTVVDNIEAQLK